ncbi:6762_t:CDS:2 [Dentiscutata heterogama]|uniref:6762_t:CDS:1 n=1 Tax=Dentiscutata heterogama TaxID=1316150 RepID=A0ACA9LZE0_9GLOM|nr:6762_t:CDS:2 [Dentiscutata heterogama]
MGCISSKLKDGSETTDSESTQNDEFRYQDGRRYHNVEGAVYPMPNDEDEQDRLHLQHFLMRYLWQSNFSAPIDQILNTSGAQVLDIGCGAGSWSFDMATTYPAVEIFGVDISPLQPTQIKPKNFTYVKANVLEGLPFEDNTFDYVYQRFMLYAYTKDDWPAVMNELVRVLKPGGFLELMEPSPYLFNVGPVNERLWNAPPVKNRGVDPDIYQTLEMYPQNQDQLENVKKEIKTIRHGVNADNHQLNKVGINNLISIAAGMKAVTTKLLQISDDEYDEMLKAAEKELYNSDSYYYLVRVYASKVVNDNQTIIQE